MDGKLPGSVTIQPSTPHPALQRRQLGPVGHSLGSEVLTARTAPGVSRNVRILDTKKGEI